jgi:hypothetical protein
VSSDPERALDPIVNSHLGFISAVNVSVCEEATGATGTFTEKSSNTLNVPGNMKKISSKKKIFISGRMFSCTEILEVEVKRMRRFIKTPDVTAYSLRLDFPRDLLQLFELSHKVLQWKQFFGLDQHQLFWVMVHLLLQDLEYGGKEQDSTI